MNSVFALPKSGSFSTGQESDDEISLMQQNGLTGLQNIGNTCYMNAALQALSNCPPLTHYFQTCSQAVACRLADRRQSVARCYAQLIEDIWWRGSPVKRRAVVDPSNLAAQFRSAYPAFRLHTQQDAQEFLRCFLDRLHEELAEPTVCFLDNASTPPSASLTPQNGSSLDSGAAGGGTATATMTSSQISNGSSSDLYSIPASHSYVKLQFTTSDVSTDYETAEDDNCDDNEEGEYDLVKDANEEAGPVPASNPPDLIPCPEPAPKFQPQQQAPQHLFKRILSSETLTVSPQPGSQIPPHRSIISDLFDGQIRSCVKCLTCGNVSTTKERFQDLSLPIPNYNDLMSLRRANNNNNGDSCGGHRFPNNSNSQAQSSWLSWVRSWLSWSGLSSSQGAATPTLNDCLSAFFVADELKGDDMYSCSHCAKLRNGVRYAELLEPLPELLCIHLKRFRHDMNNGVSKIKQPVVFPLNGLDLRPFMVASSEQSGGISRRHSSSSSSGENLVILNNNKNSSYPDESPSSSLNTTNTSTLYDLVAIVQHDGVPAAGHYTAICRHESTGLWYEYDDDCCTHVSLEKVSRAQAYVLFYRRRPVPATGIFLRHLASLMTGVVPGLARSLLLSAEWRENYLNNNNSNNAMMALSSNDEGDDDDDERGEDYYHYYDENNLPNKNKGNIHHHHHHNMFKHNNNTQVENCTNNSEEYNNNYQNQARRHHHHSRHRHSRSKRARNNSNSNNKQLGKYQLQAQQTPEDFQPSSSLLVFYVSKRWLVGLDSFALPGPVSNYDFLCEHGAVQPRLFPYVAELVEPVPEPAWQLIHETYGGGPACNKLYECHWCRAEAENLRTRQVHEFETYRRLESSGEQKHYAIAMAWWRRWRAFVSASSSSSAAYLQTNSSGLLIPPGPIDNMAIASQIISTISPNSSSSSLVLSSSPPVSTTTASTTATYQLRSGCVDFARLNEATWRFLHGIYGGGPEIALNN